MTALPAGRSPRVVHIVENLDRGSVETWLLGMLQHARRRETPVDWSFYCTLGKPGEKDELARSLGARIHYSPVPVGQKAAFVRALRATLRGERPQVLHSHHDLVSGLYLGAAFGLPIHRRIVHIHNADEEVLTPSPLKQAILRPVLRRACLTMADRVVGNSNHSLDTFLAGRKRRPGRDFVHYLGVDPRPFAAATSDRAALRQELGLAPDALILLFAGRITPEKNPVFAVEVLAAMRHLEPRAVGVFVGAGSLEGDVRRRIDELGLAQSVRMLGWRNDVPRIMPSCDWFILPHPEEPVEAFGIAVVEAQLAGLRLLLSRGVLDDPLLPTAIYRRLPLAAAPAVWAQAAIDLLDEVPSREAALAAHRASPMDMDQALADMGRLHA